MAKRFDAPFELQRLHGMGSGVYRELFRFARHRPHADAAVYAPVGSHEDPLCHLVRRLLENGATFVIRASVCRRCGTCRGAAGVATACH